MKAKSGIDARGIHDMNAAFSLFLESIANEWNNGARIFAHVWNCMWMVVREQLQKGGTELSYSLLALLFPSCAPIHVEVVRG